MLKLTAETTILATPNRVMHVAARIGRGPVLTAEACNLDDAKQTEITPDDVDQPKYAGHRWCDRCGLPAFEA